MSSISDSIKRFVPSRLGVVAFTYAILLSLACLAKGAVYDTLIALGLCMMFPLLVLALMAVKSVHVTLARLGVVLLIALVAVLTIQQALPPTGTAAQLWRDVQQLTGQEVSAHVFYNSAAWIHGLGRLLFFIVVFVIALCIGTSEPSTRVFLYTLLISGSVCITLTFLVATREGVPSSTYHSFTHGFVNPNNAAAYLGIMLLLGLTHAVRFFRLPAKPLRKVFLEILDQLNVGMLLKSGTIFFAILLALAALFMTASRGGILVTLIAVGVFLLIILLKTKLHRHLQKLVMVGVPVMMVLVCVWSFINFGQTTVSKLHVQGVDTNSRFEIMAAVLPMIRDHAMLGVGLGNFPAVFQHYRPENVSADGIIDKAHNSYLECAAELGLPVCIIILIVLGWIGFILVQGIKGREERYVVPTLGLSVWLLVALYSLIDFPLQIPAIAALVIAVVTVCASQTDRRFSEPPSTPSSAPVKRLRVRKRRRHTSIT